MQFLFADLVLDADTRELRRGGSVIAVQPQVFDLLIYLLQNRERVVSKHDLFAAVWGGRIVADSTLATHINAARRAIGDSGQEQRLIRTIARRGIRFVGAVDCQPNSGAPADAAGPRRLPATPALHEVRFCTTSDNVRIAYACVGDGPPGGVGGALAQPYCLQLGKPDLASLDRRIRQGSCLRSSRRARARSFGLGHSRLLGRCIRPGPRGRRERLSHLILFGAFAQGWRVWGNDDEIERREAIVTLTRRGWAQDTAAFRQILTSLLLPDATVDEMGWFNDLQRISASADNAARLQLSSGNVDVLDLLPGIAVPTLVLHCRGDVAIPFEQGRQIASRIPGARLVALESRNHVLLPRDPAWAAFVGEVRRFLRVEEPILSR